jgi:light-independent protochlorophyllide reductase subunit B
MRVATAMRGVHLVLHAPQGDTYADLLFTMIERRSARPPVTFTTFEARDLGADTAALFQQTAKDAFDRYQPKALLVGASCTAELIQDDPGGLARALGIGVPVIPLELPSYQKKENWGAAETLYQLVRAFSDPTSPPQRTTHFSCNLLGATALGFRHRDDATEVVRILDALGIAVNVAAPAGAAPEDLARLGAAHANIVLYPEIADTTARWLEKTYAQQRIRTIPIGEQATRAFIDEIAAAAGLSAARVNDAYAQLGGSRLPWWSRSVDSNYLTGKRVFIFGDATHALAAARIATEELGFEVVGLGTYAREFAREVRAAAETMGLEALISDDHLAVEAAIRELNPELVLGTQMERHIAKRLGIACAVISAPAHVQDYPSRYAPQMGFEGANVLFDTWVHPLVMGLEEHLLTMFRDDFEFHDEAGPSHLHAAPAAVPALQEAAKSEVRWSSPAEAELAKIPFFVRGKARRNTERFALERGLATIEIETLYDAKSHFSR